MQNCDSAENSYQTNEVYKIIIYIDYGLIVLISFMIVSE